MTKDYIGRLVKSFESGTSNGSLSLTHCGNDYGLTCGSFGMKLRGGVCINFLKKYFPDEAKDLYFKKKMDDVESSGYPGEEYCSSPEEIKLIWIQCYNKVGGETFFEYEHEYIRLNFYEPFLKKIKSFFNPNTHSRVMQECIWSWVVNKGVADAFSVFIHATIDIGPQNIPAEELLDLLYDERYNVNKFNRYKKGFSSDISERELLRKYCEVLPLPYDGTNASDGTIATGIKTIIDVNPMYYTIQIGTFRVKASADGKLIELKKAGFTNSTITYSEEHKYYRVQSGSFINKVLANNYAVLLQSKGFKTASVVQK